MSRTGQGSNPWLTECRHVQYCSIVSMSRKLWLRSVAVVALLLPGLVIAAPVAGPCGLCGDGDECHMQQPAQPEMEGHSCCDTETETSTEPSLGSSKCECGREVPPALTAGSPTSVETFSTVESILETISPTTPVTAAFSYSASTAAPPPAPPAYLIDCAFLT